MILSILFVIFFSLFPLLLWGYGTTFFSQSLWNRERFLTGMISGGLTVFYILLLQNELKGTGYIQVFGVVLLFLLIGLGIWFLTKLGTKYMRVFLRKVALLHTGIILACFLFYKFLEPYLGKDVYFLLFSLTFIFQAAIEESSKHLSSLGLTAREFRFSRRDFIIFSFFITLGFIFVENIIYLVRQIPNGISSILGLGISRISFSFLAHIFATTTCVVIWWKALSYNFFSFRYILYFLMGFVLSVFIHAVFNFLVVNGYLLGVIAFSIIAYIFFTQWLITEDN